MRGSRTVKLNCGFVKELVIQLVAGVTCEVVAAMEINPTVLEIYKHNFKGANVIRRNLQGLTAEEINELNVNAIVMSPPCQPFCRTGNRLDVEDNRTNPLSHITKLLKEVKFEYIFVENVQGFETSTARDNLLVVLKGLNFRWQEFMLTPRTVDVPNSRLRYYLIGKRKELPWSFNLREETFLSDIPNWNVDMCMPFGSLKKQYEMEMQSCRKQWKEMSSTTEHIDSLASCVGDIIDWQMTTEQIDKLRLPQSVLQKYYQAMDIVTLTSTSTCCFTKGYGHFVKGTGSILNLQVQQEDSNPPDDNYQDHAIISPSLRYFSPKEISRLMSYPEEFQLPPHLSLGQIYKSLGNSVNVFVVAILFSLLFSEPANSLLNC